MGEMTKTKTKVDPNGKLGTPKARGRRHEPSQKTILGLVVKETRDKTLPCNFRGSGASHPWSASRRLYFRVGGGRAVGPLGKKSEKGSKKAEWGKKGLIPESPHETCSS